MFAIEKKVRRDRVNGKCVFRWNRVILNLPGTRSCNPSRPWVYKVRNNEKISTDVFWYIEDGRLTAPTSRECWKMVCYVYCIHAFLWIEDAGRKRNGLSNTPGK